jgi:pyruvate formate lyase activating enzyme
MSSSPDIWEAVLGFEPLSLCDWPGRVCCVLFLGGCDLRCPTCHNREIAWHPERFPGLDASETLARIEERWRWLDGIVVTGGEPTLAPGLSKLIGALARFNLPIKVDTNGMRPELAAGLLSAHDLLCFAVDFKGPFAHYPALTGGRVGEAQASERLTAMFRLSEEFPGRISFRCTQVPGLTDEEIAEMKSLLPRKLELTLQHYVPPRPWRSEHAQADPQA